MFEDYCSSSRSTDANKVFEGATLVFMDGLHIRDHVTTYVPLVNNGAKEYFYRNCGEDTLKTSNMASGHVDPVLKLYTLVAR
jgi:hypothetical protein